MDDVDPSFRPRTRAVMTRTMGDERVLFDERTGQVHALNPTGVVLWDLLDGSWSVEELAEHVATVHSVDVATARQQIVDFVRELSSLDLLEG